MFKRINSIQTLGNFKFVGNNNKMPIYIYFLIVFPKRQRLIEIRIFVVIIPASPIKI